jgi:hypothetical protein
MVGPFHWNSRFGGPNWHRYTPKPSAYFSATTPAIIPAEAFIQFSESDSEVNPKADRIVAVLKSDRHVSFAEQRIPPKFLN